MHIGASSHADPGPTWPHDFPAAGVHVRVRYNGGMIADRALPEALDAASDVGAGEVRSSAGTERSASVSVSSVSSRSFASFEIAKSRVLSFSRCAIR